MPEEEQQILFQAVLRIYPHQEHSPEVIGVIYRLDLEADDFLRAETSDLETISEVFILDQINKCQQKIVEEDYYGAITNARTLIESVCSFILKEKGIAETDSKGDLMKLLKQVQQTIKLNSDAYSEEPFKKILNGATNIIDGIGAIRNVHSDAHGTKITKRYKIDKRHAILTINLALAISQYLYMTFLVQNAKE